MKRRHQKYVSKGALEEIKGHLKQPASGKAPKDRLIAAGADLVSTAVGWVGGKVVGDNAGIGGLALFAAGHFFDNRALSQAGLGMALSASGGGGGEFASSADQAKERAGTALEHLKTAIMPAKEDTAAAATVTVSAGATTQGIEEYDAFEDVSKPKTMNL